MLCTKFSDQCKYFRLFNGFANMVRVYINNLLPHVKNYLTKKTFHSCV